jgi:putative transcriptional regulator
MVNHHPDTRLLNEFASGTLPLAQSLCVSLHLKYCEQCQRNHQHLEQLGAAMFEVQTTEAVDNALLDSVLARLDEPTPLTYATEQAAGTAYPAVVQRLMAGNFEELEWKRITSSLKISRLKTGDREHEFALYHIKAGGSIPKHTHRGIELTQVLQGSFSDENGVYLEGDFLMRDAQQTHTPTASQSADCICIGVLDAPIKFTNWKYRPLNPFLSVQAQ